MTVPIITIDGPVSSGKGTVAREVARELGWHLLDSGALYRVLGLYSRERGVDPDDEAAVAALARELPVQFAEQDDDTAVILAGEDVSLRIREQDVSELASRVAALESVRAALLERQRAFAEAPGLVADGRDMGTVVFPDAPLKIFLTASAEERAQRRYKQLNDKGIGANLAALVEDIRARDERDRNRAVAPLRPADDATEVDSTELGVTEVVRLILDEAGRRGLA
jgi:cytidylate kinase